MARSTLMTQKAYAQRKRVSPQYISKLVGQGKIRKVGKLIDARQADTALREWKREGRVVSRGAGKSKAKPKAKKPSSSGKLYAARASREEWQAKKAELDYKRAMNELLPAAEVLEAERRKNTNIRTSLRRLARSLAPLLQRASSPAEIERTLLREFDLLLVEWASDRLDSAKDQASEAPVAPVAESDIVPAHIAGLAEIPAMEERVDG